ncbi:alkaline-phosphatase-like protein [Xylariales sp. PMI_506]|nr:alkaline-phosphatase-like protein [Xylariales sp. PMI_506]
MGSINQPSRFIELHGKQYRYPEQPVVVVCVDGFDPEYLQTGCQDGILPTMSSWIQRGFHTTAKCAMPSLTNPNNLSIITGMPTAAHGVSGNYYLDKVTGEEHMIVDDSTMWGSTILAQLTEAGARVAAITAKDKLRRIINHGLSPAKGSICFSAQYASECTLQENGIENVEEWLGQPTPAQYSGDLSLFVLEAGLKLLQEKRADVFYLTLSDYIQHKYAPGTPESNDFLGKVDEKLGEFEKLGALVGVTGDHGMSDKSKPDGEPNILFLEDFLNSKWPEAGARVICPISDPFVKHHGALGGFVRVHLTKESNNDVDVVIAECRKLPLVEVALSGAEAASLFEMPPDREGDIVVISKENAVIGGREDEHDLSQLGGHRLRSHGGLSEQEIPLIKSTPINSDTSTAQKHWRNFDVFDLVLNY